jgi:hypothetical protein
MTKKEKAASFLEWLEDLDSATIINVLSPYASDDDLAYLWDKNVEEGVIKV